MAWAKVGDGAVSPGDAQRHGFEAWGGASWFGTGDALRGRGGVFDGEWWLCVTGRRTGMSGGLLGRWGLCMHAARAARGLWASVEGGALAHARHGRWRSERGPCVWSSGWQGSSGGQGVAMDGGLPPRHAG